MVHLLKVNLIKYDPGAIQCDSLLKDNIIITDTYWKRCELQTRSGYYTTLATTSIFARYPTPLSQELENKTCAKRVERDEEIRVTKRMKVK